MISKEHENRRVAVFVVKYKTVFDGPS